MPTEGRGARSIRVCHSDAREGNNENQTILEPDEILARNTVEQVRECVTPRAFVNLQAKEVTGVPVALLHSVATFGLVEDSEVCPTN
jgi:hypothetical protein